MAACTWQRVHCDFCRVVRACSIQTLPHSTVGRSYAGGVLKREICARDRPAHSPGDRLSAVIRNHASSAPPCMWQIPTLLSQNLQHTQADSSRLARVRCCTHASVCHSTVLPLPHLVLCMYASVCERCMSIPRRTPVLNRVKPQVDTPSRLRNSLSMCQKYLH